MKTINVCVLGCMLQATQQVKWPVPCGLVSRWPVLAVSFSLLPSGIALLSRLAGGFIYVLIYRCIYNLFWALAVF